MTKVISKHWIAIVVLVLLMFIKTDCAQAINPVEQYQLHTVSDDDYAKLSKRILAHHYVDTPQFTDDSEMNEIEIRDDQVILQFVSEGRKKQFVYVYSLSGAFAYGYEITNNIRNGNTAYYIYDNELCLYSSFFSCIYRFYGEDLMIYHTPDTIMDELWEDSLSHTTSDIYSVHANHYIAWIENSQTEEKTFLYYNEQVQEKYKTRYAVFSFINRLFPDVSDTVCDLIFVIVFGFYVVVIAKIKKAGREAGRWR